MFNDFLIKDVNLRATALKEFWSDEYPDSIYLWEGAKHELHLTDIIDNDIPTVPDIFSSSESISKGHEQCKSYYYKVLPVLAGRLNAVHGTDLPVKFWQTAFGWWLYRHISVIYEKYEYLKRIDVDSIGIKLLETGDFYFPSNHYDYLLCFTGDFGVQQLVSQYIYLVKKKDYPIVNKRIDFKKEIWSIPQQDNSYDPDVALLGVYPAPIIEREILEKSAGRIGKIVLPLVPGLTNEVNHSKRAHLSDFDTENTFELYFAKSLYYCFPKDLLENFPAYYSAFNKDIKKKKFSHIVSEVWISNLPVSIYVAVAKEHKRKFISSEHGSGKYVYLKDWPSFFEDEVADIQISTGWGKTNKRFVRGGFTASDVIPYEFSEEKKTLLYIGRTKFFYWAEFNQNNAVNSTFIRELKTLDDFINLMPEKLKNNFIYRPRKDIFFWDIEKNLDLQRKKIEIDSTEDFRYSISRSRIVVIDHISTGIAELLMTNAPFILLHDTSFIPLSKELSPIFAELQDCGVIHSTAKSALEHISLIYDNVEAWWEDLKVRIAVNKFREACLASPSFAISYLLSLPFSQNRKIENLIPDSEVTLKTPLVKYSKDTNGVYINSDNQKIFNYSDGKEKEDNVLKTLRSVKDLTIFSEELNKNINDWVSEYHFSRERHNLLRHVKLNPEMNILELGCGCGSITRQLGESGANITSVEGSYSRACSAAERNRDLPNVSVYCSNFQDVDFQKKYDVVTLIGVMEYSPLFFNSDNPIRECLDLASGALKDDGILIIAIENQLGLKYFAGYHEDHTDIRYFGIEDKYNKNTAITFGRKELSGLLNQAGLHAVEFQYPFPDYKIPKVVFTSKAFNNNSFFPEAIISQLKYRDYSGEVLPSFDLGMAIQPLCRNGLMEDLSNSFLVFASRNKKNINRLYDGNLIAAFYTTDRVKHYNTKTSFLESSKGIRVRKETPLVQKNGLPDSGILKHELREERYIKGKNLESEYRKCILDKDLDQLGVLIGLQINFIINNALSSINQHNIALSEIKSDYIDCVPSNLIYENGTLHLIDREWKLKRPLSLGALLMRTVEVLSTLDGNLPELKKENLIRLLGNLGLNLDNNILQEYDRLIEEIVAQVYTVNDPKSNKPTSNFNEIQYFLEATKKVLISKKSSMPETASLADRLCSHIDEMILVYNGYCTERYFEKIRSLGPAEKDEISICEKLMKKMEGDQNWNKAREFTARLIMEIRTELEGGLPSEVNSVESNPLEEYKIFNYGEEFLGFLCPNPFLYMELREGGEVSPCCYLPFTLGNISNSSIEEIWNSEKAHELRNSILRGEYSYCDKKKCAAMQAIGLPGSSQGRYQIPYQLQERNKVDNLTLKECVITGRVDNLPNPEILSFEDDPSCNLSCPSCRDTVRALKAKESNNALLLQNKLMDSMGKNLREIWLCGAGDAFAANSYRSLLQKYDFSQFPDLKLRIDTNGMLLNQNAWKNTLKAVQDKIALVAVSVDAATAPTYEAIRRGGKFEILMNNLKFISELPQRKNGMKFIIRMIVQKKNFREMKKFIDLGISLKVDHVVFSVLQNWGTFSAEEYRAQAVHLKDNQLHGELCEILKDEIFLNEIVDLGNLSELHFKVNGKEKKVQTSIIESSNFPVESNGELKPRVRVIAFYLPQYHPIPENDKWWGKGFTEWTNVGKARPLYQGHLQPKSPSDLGYYDLRIPEARRAQADLAKKYGVEAFCYWHYWFAGQRLLERPFNEVVKSGEPDFPFCLGWANQTWSGIWHGAPNRILIEQTYPGLSDYKAHFYELLPAFSDKRYLRINGKPVFLIYSPTNLPDAKQFTEYWQNLALKEGLPGFHFIAHMTRTPEAFGCESCVDNAPFYDMKAPQFNVQGLNGGKVPRVNLYSDLVRYLKNYRLAKNEFPIVFPNWDNTPRSGANGLVLHGSTPELFDEMMNDAVSKAMLNPDPEMRIVFVKAWNEWAEGNHLEPDILYGHKYLEVVKKSIFMEK